MYGLRWKQEREKRRKRKKKTNKSEATLTEESVNQVEETGEEM